MVLAGGDRWCSHPEERRRIACCCCVLLTKMTHPADTILTSIGSSWEHGTRSRLARKLLTHADVPLQSLNVCSRPHVTLAQRQDTPIGESRAKHRSRISDGWLSVHDLNSVTLRVMMASSNACICAAHQITLGTMAARDSAQIPAGRIANVS